MGATCSHCTENTSSTAALRNAEFWADSVLCAGIGGSNRPQLVESTFDLGAKLAEMHRSKHVNSFVYVRQKLCDEQTSNDLFYHTFTILELDDGWFLCIEKYDGKLEMMTGKGNEAFRTMYTCRVSGDERCLKRCFPAFSENYQQGFEITSDLTLQDILWWLDGPCAKRWQAYDLLTAHSRRFAEDLHHFLKSGRTKQSLPEDANAVLQAVKESGLVLEYAPEVLRSDRRTVLVAVAKDGLALEFASTDLQNDLEIAGTAINQNKFAFHFASKEMQANADIRQLVNLPPVEHAGNPKLMMEALKANHWALKYASPDLLRNLQFMKQAIAVHRESLAYASPELYEVLGEQAHALSQQCTAYRAVTAKTLNGTRGSPHLDEQTPGPPTSMQTGSGLESKGCTDPEVAAAAEGKSVHETTGLDSDVQFLFPVMPPNTADTLQMKVSPNRDLADATKEEGILCMAGGSDDCKQRCSSPDLVQTKNRLGIEDRPNLETRDAQHIAKDTQQTPETEADPFCKPHMKKKTCIGCLLLFIVIACVAVLVVLLTSHTTATKPPLPTTTTKSATWPAELLATSNSTSLTTGYTTTSLTTASTRTMTFTTRPAELLSSTTQKTFTTTFMKVTPTASISTTTWTTMVPVLAAPTPVPAPAPIPTPAPVAVNSTTPETPNSTSTITTFTTTVPAPVASTPVPAPAPIPMPTPTPILAPIPIPSGATPCNWGECGAGLWCKHAEDRCYAIGDSCDAGMCGAGAWCLSAANRCYEIGSACNWNKCGGGAFCNTGQGRCYETCYNTHTTCGDSIPRKNTFHCDYSSSGGRPFCGVTNNLCVGRGQNYPCSSSSRRLHFEEQSPVVMV
eukprot:TRINITY_DN9965_c0_g1_i4.p1 TRINITY_DN9965_c0_g1~~TRINITY_DN9965_c0_g1_i4.p1  ORF type:complete len:877 (-),score=122.43 TRINITY_DN9965_c0_g1_i4:262-2814(-)